MRTDFRGAFTDLATRTGDARAVPLNRYVLFFLIAFGGLAADLATKRWIFDRLGMPGRALNIGCGPDVFGFQTSLNQGALFGMGQGMVWFFALLSMAAALAICGGSFVAGAARQWLLTVALSAIMAGILGNLYDRVGLPGLIYGVSPTPCTRPAIRCLPSAHGFW